ncbi:hypothetical protein BACCIP111899_03007 [Bacillus rhizoplanae]|uniref:Uncharacterized protein n=1 Tax=Bacillus rhizoplanae TaxID=2880966 RepID=A0ABN7ZY69_9BACI|nr:hypothetical protein BACCIP111899_03007 [Bacillus rhizoplanae]
MEISGEKPFVESIIVSYASEVAEGYRMNLKVS